MLELRNVSFSYPGLGQKTVDTLLDVNLTIAAGEILCVLGESGSGKTTLLNLLSGFLSPNAGVIDRNGAVISYLLQDDLLISFRTVWQNSFLALELQDRLSESTFAEGRALLELTKLDRFLDHLPAELSGGMRRRVALVRQLLRRSDVLLLDEPFSAQDKRMRQKLEDAVYQRCRDDRKTAVIVTHDIDSAVALADRVVLLTTHGQIARQWRCPPHLLELRPTDRRADPSFVDQVTAVWRQFWEASGSVE
jgi:NitT/TauT family transport system ATP-binding protein